MRRVAVLGLLVLLFSSNSTQAARVVLDNVPFYDNLWDPVQGWNGCTPRAAGSLIAYWDSQPGFENLYKKGDAQIWGGDATQGTKRMVASQRYLNGNTDPPDSLSSFLGTDPAGWTNNADIAAGLKAFAEWDDTNIYDMKDSYQAITTRHGIGGYTGEPGSSNMSFDVVRAEIDAGRPVLLGMHSELFGHSVLAYGYDDDITFDIVGSGGFWPSTVPGIAVMDTWTPGSGAGTAWFSSGTIPLDSPDVQEYFDPEGHEWWPYQVIDLGSAGGNTDFYVRTFATFELVPEPTTILLFALGGLVLGRRRRK